LKKGFSHFAGRRLVSGPRPKSARPTAASLPRQRRAPRQPSPAPRLACLRARPSLTRRAASRPWKRKPAAWRPCAVDAAARRSRPAPAPTRPPTSAGAAALACTLPRCLSSLPAPSSLTLPLARHRTRRSNSPPLLHLGQQSHASSSASLSGTWCSRLCRLLSPGSAF
jgi:hypothetical protein